MEKNPKKKAQEKREPGPLTKKYEREDVKVLAQTAAKIRRRVEEEKKKLRKRHEKWEKSAAKGILKKETGKEKEKQIGRTNTETVRVEIKPKIEILLTEKEELGGKPARRTNEGRKMKPLELIQLRQKARKGMTEKEDKREKGSILKGNKESRSTT